MKKKISWKPFAIAAFLIIFCSGVGFRWYVSDYYAADEVAKRTFAEGVEDKSIKEADHWLALEKGEDTDDDTGIIFYPGGKVEYLAYLPIVEKLRACGVSCYLVEMPANLAFLGKNRAQEIIDAYPEIEHWYLCGHSLGGAFASRFASAHEGEVEGLLLLGAYLYGDYPQAHTLTLYGDRDQVLNIDKIHAEDNVIVLEGGNHSQFGNYGEQDGDGQAEISSDEQQEEAVDLIMNFLQQN